MYTDDELKEIAIQIIHKLEQKYNFNESEVFIQSLSQIRGGTVFRTPKEFQSINRAGCAIRYFNNDKLFFSCFPINSVLNRIENLDKQFTYPIESQSFSFPQITEDSKSIANIYDKRIASLDEEDFFAIIYALNEQDEQIKDVILDSSVTYSLERKIIVNSSNMLAFEKGTWFDIDVRALYRGKDIIASSEKYLTSRQIPNSLDGLIDDLMSETIQSAATRAKISNLIVPVVFSPNAFADIFSFSFIPLLCKNEKISSGNYDFSSDFTLVDDGTIPGLPNSTAFDDEGQNQSKTVLIKNGDFVNELNSTQFSKDQGIQTGNSFRVKLFEQFPRHYKVYPAINPSNLLISEGDETIGELFDDVGEGIYVNSVQGHMTADSQTGVFKISTTDAHWIENGSIKGTLPSFSITGNVFELLEGDTQFSKDRKVVRPRNTPYSIVIPYLLTNKVSIFS